MDPKFIYCGKEMWSEPAIWKVALWWFGFFVVLPLFIGYVVSWDPRSNFFISFFSYFRIQTVACKVDEGEKKCYRANGRTCILIAGVVYALTLFLAFPLSPSQTSVMALWIVALVPILLSWIGSLYIEVMMKFSPPASIPILMYEDRTYKFMTSENVLIENEDVQMS